MSQNVGISDVADFEPDNSALLELRSIIRGFLMPQMTAAQKNAISNPAHGLMIVQTDNQPGEPNGIWYYDSIDAAWKNIFSTSPTSLLFSDIQTGTNTTATMTVGSGAVINLFGTGIVESNKFIGNGSVTDAIDLNTNEVAGTLNADKGGTGLSDLPPAGSFIYSDGTSFISTAQPTIHGQVLVYNMNTSTWIPQDIDIPVLPAIEDGKIWIGDVNDEPVALAISGDGTISNTGLLTVTGIQGTVVDSTQPTDGQILAFNSASGLWELSTPLFGGSVTSIGLNLPTNVFEVTNSPVTTSGTLIGTFINQVKQTVFAGPVDDPAAPPTFRLLDTTDIPNLSTDKLTIGILPIARGGTNSVAALNNNRIIVSSGGAIVEAAALTNGQLLIGSTDAAPVAGNITAANGSGVSVTNGAGTIALALSNNQSGSAWNTLGNSATTAGTNFIGTTDAVDLSFKTNNAEKMRITNAGNVGIGETTPAHKLVVKDGNIGLTNTGSAGEIRFFEPSASGNNYSAFRARAQDSNITYRLPFVNGVVNNVLQIQSKDSEGSILHWSDPVVTASPYASMTTHYANATTTTLTSGYGFYRVESDGGPNSRNVKIFNGSYSGQTIYLAAVADGNVGFNLAPSDANLRIMTNNTTFGTFAACALVWDGQYWYMLSKPNN